MTTGSTGSQSVRFSLEPVGDLSAVEELWRTLDVNTGHSFFASWTWLGTWLRMIPWDFTPQLVRAEKGGQIIAAALLVPRREKHGIGPVRQFHFNSTGEDAFDCVTTEYTDFSGPGTSDPALWPAFLEWFAEHANSDELIVPGVAAERIEGAPKSHSLLEARRNVPAFRVGELRSMLQTGIQDRLSRNTRQQLRRSIRAYEHFGPLRIDEAETIDKAQAYFTALRELHIRSWTQRGKPHSFRYGFFEKFHRALIACGIPDGSVKMLRITAGDDAIGYLYNFRRGNRIYAYQSGFDTRKNLRPGYVCHALAIAHSAERGAETYDFLAGYNRLKDSFADSRYVMSWCRYRQRKLRFQAEMIAWSAASRIAALRPVPAAFKVPRDDNDQRPA
jgi:CelD/BcsL family acetyltransferase involved in cellulose biosynthesis